MSIARPPSDSILLELSHVPVPTVLTDDASVIVAVNDAFCGLLGAAAESLVGAPLETVLNGRGERVDETRSRHVLIDDAGGRRWVECATGARTDGFGNTLTVRCFTDLSEFESRRRGRSAVVSGLDRSRLEPESGVLSRLAILQELDSEISRSRRYGNPLSGLLLVVPPGVLGSPEQLRGLVRQVNQGLRWVDSLGRVQKGAFLIVLPETDEEGARQVAAKLRADVGGHAVRIAAAHWEGIETAEQFLQTLVQKTCEPLLEAV